MIETIDINQPITNFNLRSVVVGAPGSGKTHFIGTCPKVYYLGFSLGESDTLRVRSELKQNIVKIVNIVPDNNDELKALFGDICLGQENGMIHLIIQEAK